MATIFSWKALAGCWAGLSVASGAGLVALQLTMPPPAPPVTLAAAAPIVPPTPVQPPVVAAPAPVPQVPFENRSLLALLPPAPRLVQRPAAPLPLPPIPPARHLARVEPHRPIPVYAAAPAYQPAPWDRDMPYPGLYVRARPYGYEGPRTYYGW